MFLIGPRPARLNEVVCYDRRTQMPDRQEWLRRRVADGHRERLNI